MPANVVAVAGFVLVAFSALFCLSTTLLTDIEMPQ